MAVGPILEQGWQFDSRPYPNAFEPNSELEVVLCCQKTNKPTSRNVEPFL